MSPAAKKPEPKPKPKPADKPAPKPAPAAPAPKPAAAKPAPKPAAKAAVKPVKKPVAPAKHAAPAKPAAPPRGASSPSSGLSDAQVRIADLILDEGVKLGAQRLALEASMYAAAGETNFGANPLTYVDNGSGYTGVLQGAVKDWPDSHDVTGQAQAFFTGTGPQGQTDFHYGAINLVNSGVTAVDEIAVRVEDPSIWPNNAYTGNDAAKNAMMLKQASELVGKLLPGLAPAGSAGTVVTSGGAETDTKGVNGDWATAYRLLDWSNSFKNLTDGLHGGADEAANMAKLYGDKVMRMSTIVKAG